MVTNVLIGDKKSDPHTKRNSSVLITNGPKDVFKIFNEVLEVIQAKKVKELTLRVLEVIHQILIQYQQATLMLIRADAGLTNDFLIAQSNNCGILSDLNLNILDSIKKQGICTEEELHSAFDERKIEHNSMKIIEEVMAKISDVAYIQTKAYYEGDFLSLDLEEVLYRSVIIYEEMTQKMNISSKKEAWK
jgi:hypothetical protein